MIWLPFFYNLLFFVFVCFFASRADFSRDSYSRYPRHHYLLLLTQSLAVDKRSLPVYSVTWSAIQSILWNGYPMLAKLQTHCKMHFHRAVFVTASENPCTIKNGLLKLHSLLKWHHVECTMCCYCDMILSILHGQFCNYM